MRPSLRRSVAPCSTPPAWAMLVRFQARRTAVEPDNIGCRAAMSLARQLDVAHRRGPEVKALPSARPARRHEPKPRQERHERDQDRHRDRPNGSPAADRRGRGQARHSRRGAVPVRHRQGQGAASTISSPGRAAGRQAGAGHRDHADAGRRGQDHDHRRPRRRAQPHRQTHGDLPARALARPVLRHEGRRRRRRLRPGRADGGHQPPFHRRLPCDRRRAQPAGSAARQPPLLGQRAAARRAPDHLAARDGHERSRAALDRELAGRHRQRLPARGRLRHHGRLRGHGDLLPGRRTCRTSSGASATSSSASGATAAR